MLFIKFAGSHSFDRSGPTQIVPKSSWLLSPPAPLELPASAPALLPNSPGRAEARPTERSTPRLSLSFAPRTFPVSLWHEWRAMFSARNRLSVTGPRLLQPFLAVGPPGAPCPKSTPNPVLRSAAAPPAKPVGDIEVCMRPGTGQRAMTWSSAGKRLTQTNTAQPAFHATAAATPNLYLKLSTLP